MTRTTTLPERGRYDWMVARLEPATTTDKPDMYVCPIHGGGSLHVERKGTKALVHCFGGDCTYEDIVRALDDADAVTVDRPPRSRDPRPAYAPNGVEVSRQVWTSDRWVWDPPLRTRGISPADLHGGLPSLDGLEPGSRVVLTEGHGPAIALNAAGIPAVATVTGKAGTPSAVGLAFLYGHEVVLSPDVGGDEHMERVGAVLERIAAKVLRAPAWPEDMGPNDDAADYIDRYGVEALRDHYAASTPWEPAATEDDEDGYVFGWATDVDLTEPEPLLLGYLDPTDYTVMFGDGGTGKGVIAAYWIAELTKSGWVVLLLDYEQNTVMEWVPRVTRFGGDMTRLAVAQPDRALWDALPDIHGSISEIKERFPEERIYAVIDSIGYAIGDLKLEDSSTATKYKKALNELRLPVLSLAHTVKSNADPRHPFGSTFWHNNVRHTIGVSRKDPEDEASPRVLKNRKVNRRSPFETVEIDWSWVHGDIPATLDFRAASMSTYSRVMDVMVAAGAPMTTTQVATAVNADGGPEVTLAAVSRLLQRRDEFTSDGKKPANWSLVVITPRLLSRDGPKDDDDES